MWDAIQIFITIALSLTISAVFEVLRRDFPHSVTAPSPVVTAIGSVPVSWLLGTLLLWGSVAAVYLKLSDYLGTWDRSLVIATFVLVFSAVAVWQASDALVCMMHSRGLQRSLWFLAIPLAPTIRGMSTVTLSELGNVDPVLHVLVVMVGSIIGSWRTLFPVGLWIDSMMRTAEAEIDRKISFATKGSVAHKTDKGIRKLEELRRKYGRLFPRKFADRVKAEAKEKEAYKESAWSKLATGLAVTSILGSVTVFKWLLDLSEAVYPLWFHITAYVSIFCLTSLYSYRYLKRTDLFPSRSTLRALVEFGFLTLGVFQYGIFLLFPALTPFVLIAYQLLYGAWNALILRERPNIPESPMYYEVRIARDMAMWWVFFFTSSLFWNIYQATRSDMLMALCAIPAVVLGLFSWNLICSMSSWYSFRKINSGR
jgi:uncharacterized protein (DUF983 family)